MKSSSLENKTIRPGLLTYSFYASDRHPIKPVKAKAKVKAKPKSRGGFSRLLLVCLIAAGLFAGYKYVAAQRTPSVPPSRSASTQSSGSAAKSSAPAATAIINECAGNTLDQFIKVSISQRHMWACQGTQQVYDSPVVTGIEYLAADKTPTGTYHIYAKITDTTLTGHDSTGSWSDYVNYWMPWLNNQYGTYGFHDATWRPANAFGNISPDSADASHGCVELPLQTAKWLYNWSQIGTTLTIVS